MTSRIRCGVGLIAFAGLVLAGCATPIVHVHPETYDLHLTIAPQQNRLTATVRMHCLSAHRASAVRQDRMHFEFGLHPNLKITELRCEGAEVCRVQALRVSNKDGSPPVRRHRITLGEAVDAFDLVVSYTGTLHQDISAGEKRGEIHNFGVSAHIGTNGIYLASGAWFPQMDASEDRKEASRLSHYRVHLKPVPDYTFVSSAPVHDRSASNADTVEFESDFGQTGLALVGGHYRTWTRDVDGVRFRILLNPANGDRETLERRADIFLTAAVGYYRRYEPLVGPYPYDDFTIVENFFSSGFAFPTFTLLGPAVIAMEDRALRHGYLDHELLHSWCGNGVYVDDSGGNWCEALTSFGANLYGYTLDGDAEGSRKTRRDACNILTRISEKYDKPLASFGLEHGAGRSIGYQKGAVVFNMIARKIGVENFWQAMRKLTADFTGKFAGWETFRTVFEEASGKDLERFFSQWVYGTNAPRFTFGRTSFDANRGCGVLEIEQDDPPFAVDLPLRIHDAGGISREIIVPIANRKTVVHLDDIPLPAEVELDPDYRVARKLSGDETLPTISGSLRGNCAVLVRADTDKDGSENDWPGYGTFAGDVLDKRKPDTTEQTVTPDSSALSDCTVIVVGNAVRQPQVQALLARSECPIRWHKNGFEIDGQSFSSARESVLCTVRHPDAPGKTITIYYGNSEESLSNAGLLWFYGNSLLVYRSSDGGRADVVLRRDLERTQRVTITRDDAHGQERVDVRRSGAQGR